MVFPSAQQPAPDLPPQRRSSPSLLFQRKPTAPPLTACSGSRRTSAAAAKSPTSPALRLLTITADTHLAFLRSGAASASFLQCPSWAAVKPSWHAEHVGWADPEGNLVGCALVLYRRLPRTSRSIAYLPEGPVIDWSDPDLTRWLEPLCTHLRARKAFAAKIGPPVAAHLWSAETLRDAVADTRTQRIRELTPDLSTTLGHSVERQLTTLGWRRGGLPITGRGEVQPSLVFEVTLAGLTADDLWAGLNQQWRRNIRKAEKSGVQVTLGGFDDLAEFHRLLQTTQVRDGFDLGRSLEYFQRQYAALTAEEPNRIRLYLASCAGEVLAAHWMVVSDRRAWYLYGASADHRREVRPSHALQWRMMQDAIELGCEVYDMRGFTDTLDRDDPRFGLLQWKLGTGGQAAQYLGEWDLPLSRPLYAAARWYLGWRR